MIGFGFSHKYPMVDGNAVKLDTQKYRNHLMRTTVSDGSPRRRQAERTALGDPPIPGEHYAEVVNEVPGTFLLYYNATARDITWHLDEFAVYHCRPEKHMGNVVLLHKGDCLPVYISKDCGKGPSHAQVSKYQYLLVVGPPGVIACVLLRTGTKLWSSRQKKAAKRRRVAGAVELEYWYDEVPKLLSAEDLGGEDPQAIRSRMASHKWQVCFTRTCYSFVTRMLHPQHQHVYLATYLNFESMVGAHG